MRHRDFRLAFFIGLLAVMALGLMQGCASLKPVSDALFLPAPDPRVAELEKDKAALIAVLNDPNSTDIDRKLAEKGIQGIDRAKTIVDNGQEGDSLLTEILSALGGFIPGATIAAAISRRAGQRLKQRDVALAQAGETIEHIPPADRQAVIDKTQDSTTQALLAKAKAET